jgi:hypothetical protein
MLAGDEASLQKKPQKYIHFKKIQIMYLRYNEYPRRMFNNIHVTAQYYRFCDFA